MFRLFAASGHLGKDYADRGNRQGDGGYSCVSRECLRCCLEAIYQKLEDCRDNQADAAADTAWRVARAYAKAMSSHPEASVAAIGKTIYDLFVKFGDLASLGFHEEYGRYYNLLQELANVREEDREAAAFDPWLENMDDCYHRFINLRDAKVTEDTTYQTGIVKESRTAAEEAYKVFVQRVNALCIVMGEEAYAPFIDQVNVVIDTLNSTIAARETKAAKKRVKEEDKE